MRFSDIKFKGISNKKPHREEANTARTVSAHDRFDPAKLVDVYCGVHGEELIPAKADLNNKLAYPHR